MIMSLCGSVAAADTLIQPSYQITGIYSSMFPMMKELQFNIDSSAYGGPNNTYYIKSDGGGQNALHITTNSSNQNGQVTVINSPSTTPSGVFYVTDTGGRGFNDDIILLLSVKGPISDNFTLHIRSSGYGNWTLATPGSYNPPMPTNYQYMREQ